MIRTVFYTLKMPAEFRDSDALIWTRAVCWANKWFPKNVVLVSDEPGRKLLIDFLGLPFARHIPLPSIPKAMEHVYGIAKLHAHHIACREGKGYVHLDHDGILRKALDKTALNAACIAEHRYTPKPFAEKLLKRMPKPPVSAITSALACGISGGNDLAALSMWSKESLRCATDPDNAAMLAKANGFQASVLLEECAIELHCGKKAEMIYRDPAASMLHQAQRSGWYHMAGLKRNRGARAQAELRCAWEWPKEHRRTLDGFNSYLETL